MIPRHAIRYRILCNDQSPTYLTLVSSPSLLSSVYSELRAHNRMLWSDFCFRGKITSSHRPAESHRYCGILFAFVRRVRKQLRIGAGVESLAKPEKSKSAKNNEKFNLFGREGLQRCCSDFCKLGVLLPPNILFCF